jgi:hypothetical protein
MSIHDLKIRMADVAGIETLTMGLEAGRILLRWSGYVAAVDASASDAEIEAAVRNAIKLRRPSKDCVDADGEPFPPLNRPRGCRPSASPAMRSRCRNWPSADRRAVWTMRTVEPFGFWRTRFAVVVMRIIRVRASHCAEKRCRMDAHCPVCGERFSFTAHNGGVFFDRAACIPCWM